jgi:hypothetical protein
MTKTLIDTLKGLKADPSLVLQLYGQLFEATFYLLVRKGTETSLDKAEFLTYDTQDNIRELPLFTTDKFLIDNLLVDALAIQVGGQSLWLRLLGIIETGKCEVAINPGQTHGIRLTKEMIIGMIEKYGTKQKTENNVT